MIVVGTYYGVAMAVFSSAVFSFKHMSNCSSPSSSVPYLTDAGFDTAVIFSADAFPEAFYDHVFLACGHFGGENPSGMYGKSFVSASGFVSLSFD